MWFDVGRLLLLVLLCAPCGALPVVVFNTCDTFAAAKCMSLLDLQLLQQCNACMLMMALMVQCLLVLVVVLLSRLVAVAVVQIVDCASCRCGAVTAALWCMHWRQCAEEEVSMSNSCILYSPVPSAQPCLSAGCNSCHRQCSLCLIVWIPQTVLWGQEGLCGYGAPPAS